MKHRCHRCGRVFARWEHLSRHERSHTKEKPFHCTDCPQAFTRKDLLSRHIRIHHVSANGSVCHQKGSNHSAELHSPVVRGTKQIDGGNAKLVSSDPEAAVGPLLNKQSGPGDEMFLPGFNNPISPRDMQIALPIDTGNINESQHADYTFWSPSYPLDFSAYLDTVDHPTGPFSSTYQPLPFHASAELAESTVADNSTAQTWPFQVPPNVESSRPSESAVTSRAPSIQPPVRHKHDNIREKCETFKARFEVDEQCRKAMLNQLENFQHVLPPGWKLPTKHTLSRFVYGWLTAFDRHYPMIHLPSTFLPNMSIELFLAITSLGAQYCYEREKGRPLFDMSKAVALERARRLSERGGLHVPFGASRTGTLTQTAQALTILIAVSMWSQSDPSVRDALFLRSSLLAVLRDAALDPLSIESVSTSNGRDAWIRYETVKRTKLISFCFLNLLTIAFDMPPVLLCKDMQVTMPCDEHTWTSDVVHNTPNPAGRIPQEATLVDILDLLLSAYPGANVQIPSQTPFGNYILIHAIIQHLWLTQQTQGIQSRGETDGIPQIEAALKVWQESCWKRDQASFKEPTDLANPLPFTSLALLRLAYIRAATGSRFAGFLNIWHPEKIGQALSQGPSVRRDDKTSRLALHCAQAIAIPIKTGLNFVAHTQVFYWSNQYALCSFECALLLSKWLEAVTTEAPSPPRSPKEDRVLDFVIQLMEETKYDMSREQLLSGKTLSILVVRLWATLFRRNHVWELVSIIGMSLEAYADCLERQPGG